MEPDKEMLQFLISSHQPCCVAALTATEEQHFQISAVSKELQPGFGHVTDQLDQVLSKTCGSELATKFLAVKYS